MAGSFTDIISIDAPSSAQAGETVNITVKIKNIYTSVIGIQVNGTFNSSLISFPTDWANVNAGATHSFYGSFTMPSHDVELSVWSWYYGADGYWHFDDTAYESIDLGAAPAQWYRLARTTITLQVETAPPEDIWYEMAKVNILVDTSGELPEGWYEMAKLDVSVGVAGEVGGWYELAKTSISLTVGSGVEPPPPPPNGEEEEGEFPWIPVALAAGAAIVGGVAIADAQKKKKAKVGKS